MKFDDRRYGAQPPEPVVAAPARCPFCRSDRVTTTRKEDDHAYWRCQGCGQIWNPARLKSSYR